MRNLSQVSGNSDLGALIGDAAGSDVPVDELLRRLKVVATRARLPELEAWVQNELGGYENADDLPTYRGPFPAHVLGFFSGPFQSSARNVPIAPSAFPEDMREGRLFQVRFFDSVAELEVLSAADSGLRIPWPADALMLCQYLVSKGRLDFSGNVLQEAHQVVSRATVVGILRTVRDRVLTLALRLEQENPDLGQAGAPAASPAAARDVQIIVHGGQPNIAVASTNVSQSVTITPGNKESLVERLRELGVQERDVADLVQAVEADEAEADGDSRHGPGRRVAEWLGQLSLRAGTAAGDSLAQQAGQAIGQYFG